MGYTVPAEPKDAYSSQHSRYEGATRENLGVKPETYIMR